MATDAERVKQWRRDNPDKVKEQKKRHTKKYLERNLARIADWKTANADRAHEAQLQYDRDRYSSNPQAQRDAVKASRFRRKLEIIAAYGSKCKCCGESRHEFLTIDHIKGGGRKHTESLGLHGAGFHAWLRKHGYPQEDYRLLCIACNFSLGHFGYCPHERENFDAIGLAC